MTSSGLRTEANLINLGDDKGEVVGSADSNEETIDGNGG